MNIVRPITFAVVSANLLNFAGNWLFMYGNWGAPRLGLEGSGYSTSISRVYIALVLLIAVLRHERKHGNLHLAGELASAVGAHPAPHRPGLSLPPCRFSPKAPSSAW